MPGWLRPVKGGAAWAPGSFLDTGSRLRTAVCSLLSLVVPVGNFLVDPPGTESSSLGVWGISKKSCNQEHRRAPVAAQPVVPVLGEPPVTRGMSFCHLQRGSWIERVAITPSDFAGGCGGLAWC